MPVDAAFQPNITLPQQNPPKMTITTHESTGDPTDLEVLSLTRLFARLEHNLLSPAADLNPLRQSEYQRMRVGANIDYARTTLHTLERSLPQIKPLERRHEVQTGLSRHRKTLKRLQNVLDEIAAEAALRDDNDESDAGAVEDLLLGTPDEGNTSAEEEEGATMALGGGGSAVQATATATEASPPATTTTTDARPESTPTAAASTLRNRSHAAADGTATATGSSVHEHRAETSKLQATEQTLSDHRAEQEELTNSLLSLATQLKTSSQAFQSSLESEKSVLQRAVDGIDRTTSNMEAAERRMGMLRRMTEGKGWWGRIMLYAWIFGLWLVAVLIVFLGPKLRL
ncbi:hypothetical protein BDV59DRAFT_199871 [Aspergillus ambiguus]|uniref:uncharacterized protein n=1 Tax=Aspergillus ambiguus TaxID=176160 RepID=UPI003CCD8457